MNDPLLALLGRYEQAFPAERSMIDRVRWLAKNRDNCFERDCLPGHITGSGWVVSSDCGRCLLLHHRKLDRWLQPGGHADGDPDVLGVAAREVREETGLEQFHVVDPVCPLDIDVHQIPERADTEGRVVEPAHEHHDIRFLFATPDASRLTLSEESHAVRWFTDAEARRVTQEESVLRMLRKAQHRLAG